MKSKMKSFAKFLNENYFYVLAVVSLLIPDIMLKYLVWPKVYGEFFATIVPLAFDFCWIFILLLGILFFLPKNWGRAVFGIIGGFFILFSFAQYIYFQIFNQFFRISSIALAGEGGEYFSYAISYLDARVGVCSAISIFCLVLALIRWKRPTFKCKWKKAFVIVPIFGLVLMHIFMQPQLFGESDQDWDSWSKPRVIYQKFNDVNKGIDVMGLYQFTARDIYKSYFAGSKYGEADFEKVRTFSKEKLEAKAANEFTGALKGKNLIAVMLEGIDDWMISEKYTPTMKYMMENGINFENYYAPTFGTGYTLGSEFCFHTGFYTPPSEVSAVNFAANSFPYALPKLFADAGYSANSFHYNNQEFYNRGIMHKSLGYEKYHSFQDYGLPEYVAQADSNIMKYDEIYADMTKNAPFFSFVITYSGHVPYTFDDAKLALAKENHPELVDNTMLAEKNNCLILARDTDDFFKGLLERLEKDGLLEDTVIAVFTDHYAYGFSDQGKLLEYNKAVGDELMYRVPAFIYSEGLTPKKITKPTHTADLLPTLINLFGLYDSGYYIGEDALSLKEGFAYFGNSAWLDESVYYVPGEEAPKGQEERVKRGCEKVRQSLEINDIVIVGDYFKEEK
ncbi:MAG: LTA synthase family protein [Clostridia bacterium]|nr:LTA synthase family protein [Clostridia bacterium]